MTVPVSRVARALSLFALAAECSAFVHQSLRFKVPTPAVGMPRCAHGEAHCWSTSRRRPAPRRIRALEGFLSMAASSKKNRGDTDVSQLECKKMYTCCLNDVCLRQLNQRPPRFSRAVISIASTEKKHMFNRSRMLPAGCAPKVHRFVTRDHLQHQVPTLSENGDLIMNPISFTAAS